ncbi:unnamed protein product [Adineta steineri]|uniref:Uncharacterized protein n=1 Tax=Adineta steineri TaxID=433720 RepID=A0A815LH52_9BILA|nr:unnamed protein product [Adineta steineri]
MATAAASTFSSYDISLPSSSINSDSSAFSSQNHGFFTNNLNSSVSRIGHSLDDMDILSLKRQYANLELLEQSTLSNSAEDLSQLDRMSHPFEIFGQDQNDMDDYDIPYDEGADFDYFISIQERLKKANQEFQQDQTPIELNHHQRVSFDAIVKAVNIDQDPTDKSSVESAIQGSSSSSDLTNSRNEDKAQEYTIPLNDTLPKEGPTLLEQIKALQFNNPSSTDERWATAASNDNLENREDDKSASSKKTIETNNEIEDITDPISTRKSMIVSVNGQFALQDEDDYTAKKSHSTTNNKILFLPTPPTEPKQKQDKPSRPFSIRPKSSDNIKRTNNNNSNRASTDKKNNTEPTIRQRPKSAGALKPTEKSSSGVDFDELLRKGAEKKRTELREERRKKEEDEEKRKKELAKAKESYERWLEDKNSERKRINTEKRLEKEEEETRQIEQDKELNELREKKFKEWVNRKNHEVILANEFKKLMANEDEIANRGSSSSINNGNKNDDHRAFRRWLRQKYEQSLEEKRRIRLETKQRRRRERRSLKRYQLQQDIQLAKSYGYS